MTPLRILLVEDEDDLRAMVARWLVSAGCAVTQRARLSDVTGEDVRAAHCVVADLLLADSSQAETTDWIRRTRRTRRVVVASGYVDLPAALRFGHGRVVALPKPFDDIDLVPLVVREATAAVYEEDAARHAAAMADSLDGCARALRRMHGLTGDDDA